MSSLFLMLGSHKDRAIARDEVGNVIVDTCATLDSDEPYETGIKKGRQHWVIVEMYTSKSGAIKGHKKWVEAIRKNPRQRLKGDIGTSVIGKLTKRIQKEIKEAKL